MIKLALKIVIEKGWKEVIIQGTDGNFMSKTESKDHNDSKATTTIENVLYLSSLFSRCKFQHISSNSNAVADKVAKFAVKLRKVVLWE